MKAATKKAAKKRNIGEELQAEALAAAALAEQVEVLTKQLESLKASIREKAGSLMGGLNTFEFPTDAGPCRVTRVKDHMQLAKGFDPEALRHTLPADMFDTFFTTKVVLRPEADAAFARLTGKQVKSLGPVCPFEFVPRAAQVRLPKGGAR